MKPIETTFKRIETKYVVSKEILDKLVQDLKEYLVEDDYPISTISNIYFDTEDFQLIQDSLQKTLIFSKMSILESNAKKRYGCGPISANLK